MDYKVEAVDIALRLLLLVSENPDSSLATLSEKANINKSRAFRLLYNLEANHFVRKNEANGSYTLGTQALALGIAAQQQNTLLKVSRPYLEALSKKLDETIVLRIREGFETISVNRIYSTKAIRVHIDMGNKLPLNKSASGKLMLAFAPQVLIDEYFLSEEIGSAKFKKGLAKELEVIRAQGYAQSDGEVRSGVFAVAVPLYDAAGLVCASLSVSIPKQEIESDKYLAKIRQVLISNAALISNELGYRG